MQNVARFWISLDMTCIDVNTMTAADGITYERKNIEGWIARELSQVVCGAQREIENLSTPQHDLSSGLCPVRILMSHELRGAYCIHIQTGHG